MWLADRAVITSVAKLNELERHAGYWRRAMFVAHSRISRLAQRFQSVRGFDRVSVTVSFFLGIPTLVAAGLLEVAANINTFLAARWLDSTWHGNFIRRRLFGCVVWKFIQIISDRL